MTYGTKELNQVKAIAAAIYQLKEVPSGHLYARVMGSLSLEAYQRIIEVLKNAGLVTESNHLLAWKE